MGGKEIGVRNDVFFTFYSLLSTSLFSGETLMNLRLTKGDENNGRTTP
ncbi:MAG: hypothetical protein AB1414_15675 [bacterium]